MTTKACGHKKHTPIVSERQRRLFGAAASGQAYAAPSLSKAEAMRHLKEAKGKSLPERLAKRKTKKKG